MTSLTICGIALVLEALIGYPAALFAVIGHPVTWIGHAIDALETRFNNSSQSDGIRRRNGIVAMIGLVATCGLVAWVTQTLLFAILPPGLAILATAILATTGLAQKSLDTHVQDVANALDRDIVDGHRAVARIVGRDVDALDAAGVSRAAIESLAESFADGVVAPAFWLALLGLPGVMMLKAINTADSMIGHRTPRFQAFGFCAAKLDDVINWLAARLATLFLVGAAALMPGASARDAWRIAKRDAKGHPSPNAGWPEAAMAGALGLRLGGARAYGGDTVEDAAMGDGTPDLDAASIRRALRLYRIACAIEIGLVVLLAMISVRV